MEIRVGILGATGRMGREVYALVSRGFSVSGNILRFGEAVARGVEKITGDGVSISTFENASFKNVDVWIDFSQPDATLELVKRTTRPVVICTTGFSETQLKELEVLSASRPLMIAPNTSPGLVLILSMFQNLPQVSKQGFDIFIEEAHHSQKRDKPSGTAKQLVRTLEKSGNQILEVHSIRAGGEKGRHRISFTAQEEEFVVEHRVFDRVVFARGALLAGNFMVGRGPGMYSMQDVWASYKGGETNV